MKNKISVALILFSALTAVHSPAVQAKDGADRARILVGVGNGVGTFANRLTWLNPQIDLGVHLPVNFGVRASGSFIFGGYAGSYFLPAGFVATLTPYYDFHSGPIVLGLGANIGAFIPTVDDGPGSFNPQNVTVVYGGTLRIGFVPTDFMMVSVDGEVNAIGGGRYMVLPRLKLTFFF